MQRFYNYCGKVLQSDSELPELPGAPTRGAGNLVFSANVPRELRAAADFVVETDQFVSTTRVGDNYELDFSDGAKFVVNPTAGTIGCTGPAIPSIRHQLLDHVLPRTLNHQGFLMVHGSAIRTDQGTVVFIGESGRGKSTLAAAYHDAGYELLTDDCSHLAIDRSGVVYCTPTYRSLRLWADSAEELMPTDPYEAMRESSDKRSFDMTTLAQSTTPVEVAGILSLAPPTGSNDVGVMAIDGSVMMTEFISQCFRLDPTAIDVTRRIFEETTTIIAGVRTGELRYERNHNQLPLVREEVLRWLAET